MPRADGRNELRPFYEHLRQALLVSQFFSLSVFGYLQDD